MTMDPHKPNGTHRLVHFWPVIVVGAGALVGYGALQKQVSANERTAQAVPVLESKVAVLESRAVDGNRVTRLEEQMVALTNSIDRLQRTLDREERRERRE